MGWDPPVRQHAADEVGEVVVDQIDARDVHAEPQLPAVGQQRRVVGGRQLDGGVGDGGDEPDALGPYGMNTSGWHHPAVGVRPAHQRLHPHHPTGEDVDRRLVVDLLEGPLGDGVAEVLDELQAVALGVVLGRVPRHVATVGLGVVHGHVRRPEQLAPLPAVDRRRGQPDARADVDGHLVEGDGIVEHAHQCDGHRTGLVRIGLEHHTPNSSPPNRATTAPGGRRGEPGPHHAEEPVAGQVAQRVVDLL